VWDSEREREGFTHTNTNWKTHTHSHTHTGIISYGPSFRHLCAHMWRAAETSNHQANWYRTIWWGAIWLGRLWARAIQVRVCTRSARTQCRPSHVWVCCSRVWVCFPSVSILEMHKFQWKLISWHHVVSLSLCRNAENERIESPTSAVLDPIFDDGRETNITTIEQVWIFPFFAAAFSVVSLYLRLLSITCRLHDGN
jgi:hypothetical protein